MPIENNFTGSIRRFQEVLYATGYYCQTRLAYVGHAQSDNMVLEFWLNQSGKYLEFLLFCLTIKLVAT